MFSRLERSKILYFLCVFKNPSSFKEALNSYENRLWALKLGVFIYEKDRKGSKKVKTKLKKGANTTNLSSQENSDDNLQEARESLEIHKLVFYAKMENIIIIMLQNPVKLKDPRRFQLFFFLWFCFWSSGSCVFLRLGVSSFVLCFGFILFLV